MTCASAPYRQLAIGMIFLAMPGMPWALSVKTVQPAPSSEGPLIHIAPHAADTTLGENVIVHPPQASPASASLILLMGYGGDLSWTMTQWWYLATNWASSDQKWCQPSCIFSAEDVAAVQNLRNNVRIVDAVGNIVLAKGSHAWYRYTQWPDGPPVAEEMETSVTRVFNLIEAEYKIVGDYGRIAIAGLSQGADLALEVGIRFPQRLGMVISERGVLHPLRKGGNFGAGPGTPFILTAGDSDELSSLDTYKADCVSLQQRTPTYFKMYQGLDHGSFSKGEWKLALDAFILMLAPGPKDSMIHNLALWDTCAR